MGSTGPVISVLMTVHNGARYLLEAIESILRQRFEDFEFLIVDDGSSDSTSQILSSVRDSRIVTYRNDVNLGIPKSLNRMLPFAQGRYITRMDADDVSMEHRFVTQVRFLETHPEIGLVGSTALLIDPYGAEAGVLRVPTGELEIRWKSLLINPFVQSSVMLRRTLIDDDGMRYDERFRASQDYDLWTRMLEKTRGCNLSEPFIKYRIHGKGVTGTQRDQQLRNHDIIAFQAISRTLPGYRTSLDEVSALRRFVVGKYPGESATIVDSALLIRRYMKLFAAFAARFSHTSELADLRRREVIEMAGVLARQPRGLRWLHVAAELFAMEPALIGLAARRRVRTLISRSL